MSSLTPKVYVMSLTAEEIERRLLSIDNFLLKTIIRQSLLNPATDTAPSTQCVVDALAPINATISSLGDLALKDSVALVSNETIGILPLSKGGTGGSKLADAQQNLGILTQTEIQTLINNSIPTVQSVDLSSNQVNGVLSVSKGGTGSNIPSNALKNLGIHDSSGKVPVSQLPDVATHETATYTVSTQSDMTSLNAMQGDFCIRLDTSETYILKQTPSSVISNWEVVTFHVSTHTVNSQTGMLSLLAYQGDICVRTDTSQTFVLKQLPASILGNWQEILNDSYKRITPQVFQSLKRTHAVYGKNLVAGSFETGGTLNNSSDGLIQESTGNSYSWSGTFPKTVSAGTDPTADPLWKVIPIGETIFQKPVLSVEWIQKRSAMWAGYGPADGQTLSRSLYPDALAAIQAGMVPVCSDADWLADPAKRGCYTLGDGSTTFRVPDYNGMQPGSYGPVYLGGGASGGVILRDRIQNITGETNFSSSPAGIIDSTATAAGAFKVGTSALDARPSDQFATARGRTLVFDASGSVRTGETTRPITVEGCLAIKLFGAVQNSGSADAAALATAVADLAAKVSVVEGKVAILEQRKSTCLVNATGTGAPHETVVTQLPANVVSNARYVLPNPFGVNTPVLCVAELFLNGVWADTGFAYSAGGFGTKASYVQGVGIVVQTGSSRVNTGSALTGGGHNTTSENSTAPCRVFVRKLEA